VEYHFVIAVWNAKQAQSGARVKYWEIIADKLSKAGWSWGCVATMDHQGRRIFVADAHRGDGQRFVVRADEKLTAFLELEAAIPTRQNRVAEGGKCVLKKIISGGQTGADSAGLDFAIWHEIPHGGWCPKGRLCENGTIDPRYQLKETSTKNYLQRTEKNVRDSDGTVIFTISPDLTGGSKKTAELAAKNHKPWIHLHQRGLHRGGYAEPELLLLEFLREHNIGTLNVAGTRASKEPDIYKFVKYTLENALFPRPAHGTWLGGPGEG
jgi:Circularly permutated YpsA SLOG family